MTGAFHFRNKDIFLLFVNILVSCQCSSDKPLVPVVQTNENTASESKSISVSTYWRTVTLTHVTNTRPRPRPGLLGIRLKGNGPSGSWHNNILIFQIVQAGYLYEAASKKKKQQAVRHDCVWLQNPPWTKTPLGQQIKECQSVWGIINQDKEEVAQCTQMDLCLQESLICVSCVNLNVCPHVVWSEKLPQTVGRGYSISPTGCAQWWLLN